MKIKEERICRNKRYREERIKKCYQQYNRKKIHHHDNFRYHDGLGPRICSLLLEAILFTHTKKTKTKKLNCQIIFEKTLFISKN
jgi:hypothetical protein